MDRKSHPFSSLTQAEFDAIVDHAHRERAIAIAATFKWAFRTLRRAIVAIFRRSGARRARARNPLAS